jgi:hypothetical protein
MNTIAIDFDGVLIDHPHSLSFEECLQLGLPTIDSVEILNYLSKFYKLVVLTARKDDELIKVKQWLSDYGFPKMEVTNKKMDATLYIDDRCLRFTSWADISKILK